MRCPNCDSENSDSSKFCRRCGTPLKKTINHQELIDSMSFKQKNNTAKYIIIALALVAVILAGVFVYIYTSPSTDNSQTPDSVSPSMQILGGSFQTGSGLSDKTHASIYVGSRYSGEDVVIQIKYSRDGNSLNNANMVAKTVDSSGYINVKSADAYRYFPDFAKINLYDASGNLIDTRSVTLSPTSATQSF